MGGVLMGWGRGWSRVWGGIELVGRRSGERGEFFDAGGIVGGVGVIEGR
jgi:hypothetical protein